MTSPKHEQTSVLQDTKTETYCELSANGKLEQCGSIVIIATDLWELGNRIAIKKMLK